MSPWVPCARPSIWGTAHRARAASRSAPSRVASRSSSFCLDCFCRVSWCDDVTATFTSLAPVAVTFTVTFVKAQVKVCGRHSDGTGDVSHELVESTRTTLRRSNVFTVHARSMDGSCHLMPTAAKSSTRKEPIRIA